MRNDGHPQIPSKTKVKHPRDQSVDDIFDDASDALIKVSKSKQYVDQQQAQHPRAWRAIAETGDAVHEIAKIDELFSTCGECPGKSQAEEQKFEVSLQWLKGGKIRRFPVSQIRMGWLTNNSKLSMPIPPRMPAANVTPRLWGRTIPTSFHPTPRQLNEIHAKSSKRGVLLKGMRR